MLGEVAVDVAADDRPCDVEVDDCLDRVGHVFFLSETVEYWITALA
jgi:hypothetical protein